jgi:hypothetical protein
VAVLRLTADPSVPVHVLVDLVDQTIAGR